MDDAHYNAVRTERSRQDVYGRRIGRPSTATGRMIYKPPPNFTIQQLRKYKRRKEKQALVKEAGLEKKRLQLNGDNPLLLSDNIRAFNAATNVQTKLAFNTHSKRRRNFDKPNRSHAQDCDELRTVVEKFRDDYYYTPQGEKIRNAHFPEATSWFKGQWVECLHKSRWHPGQIANIHLRPSANGVPQGHLTFDIRYPSDVASNRVDHDVPENKIRWMPPRRNWYVGEPVVVNWLKRGQWYTAAVAKVHLDGSNSVDVKFDDGRTVGCVHGPRYETRVPLELIQQVRWYKGQPVLAQFRGKSLWYRAHVVKVEKVARTFQRPSPIFRGKEEVGKKEEEEDDEKCTVTVRYDGLGGGEIEESGVTRKYLRPLLGGYSLETDASRPVLQSDNFGSSIESVFEPDSSQPGSIDLAWYWGNQAPSMSMSSTSATYEDLRKRGSHRGDGGEKIVFDRDIVRRLAKLKRGPDGPVAPLRSPLLPASYEQYSLDGHARVTMNAETNEEKRLRLAKKRRDRRKKIESESNLAITAAASPDQLVNFKRQGPGLEQVTIRMSHSDLGKAGLVLQKFVNSIDGVGYRSGTPIVKFYVTVRPGSYDALSSTLESLSDGTATVALATQEEKKVHFSGSTTRASRAARIAEGGLSLVDADIKREEESYSSEDSSSERLFSHQEIVTFLNWCRRGDQKRVQQFLVRANMSPGGSGAGAGAGAGGTSTATSSSLVNVKTGMNPLLSATLGGHIKMVKLLLAAQFDAKQCDYSGRCAMDLARKNLAQCHAEMAEQAGKNTSEEAAVVEEVLLWQCMVGILSNDTSVYQAAMEGDLSRLRYLERCQSETKSSKRRSSKKRHWLVKPNKYGCTPLHLAVMHGQIEAVKWIDRRVDMAAWRAMNLVGQTPDDLCVTAPCKSDMLMALAEKRR